MARSILGLAALNRKIKALPTGLISEVRKALEESAAQIVAMAKSLVAVDDGSLRDSIGWTWGKAPRGAMTLGKVVGAGLAGDLTITIYAGNSDAFYARWVEFGTAPHTNGGQFAGTEHPGTSAQPFFYPSYRANRKSARRRVSTAIRRGAKKVAGQ